MGSLKK